VEGEGEQRPAAACDGGGDDGSPLPNTSGHEISAQISISCFYVGMAKNL
jgi:hypothetical protein